MSHPSLGKPPRSQTAGFPVGAARLRESRSAVAARALEVAIDADRSIRGRYDDAGLRNLLRDTEVLTERLALCVAGDDPYWLTEFADQTAPVFRRRGVPMDDAIRLLEGIRSAARGVLSPEEQVPADKAIVGKEIKIDPKTGDVNALDITVEQVKDNEETFLMGWPVS